MHMTLLLIDDELVDVNEFQQAVEEFGECTDRNGRKWSFSLEHLPGEKEKSPDGIYQDYDDRIFSRIQDRIDRKTEEEQIGILLDVMLDAAERDSGKKLYSYPRAKLAPEIYKRFCNVVPIYVVTRIPQFYMHCKEIMGGVDMSEKFIHKPIWLEYKVKSQIEKLQDYYINWTGENH